MAVRRSTRPLLIAFLLVVLSASSLFAAQVRGKITRADGSGIGGVIVQAAGTDRATLSDSNGAFDLDVPPGTYTISFTAGEKVATQENVVVAAGSPAVVNKQVDWNLSIAETITVYSASRRAERITEAPAAVTVAPEEEIEAVAASGQAARIVENAPGVDFTQSGLYDTNFNARGFNSSLNRRILTLIDGRDPAIAFLGAQEWAALSFPVDEMASVELVRGPGSALYGANAFSGVLNMTTKSPRDSQGGRLMLSGGDLNTRRADLRHAGGFGNDWYYKIVGGYQNSDDFARSRNATVEYSVPCAASGAINCLPREARPLALDEVNIKFGGLRLDKYFANTSVLTLEGGYSTLEGPVFQTGIGRVQVTDVERPWGRVNYNMLHWNLNTYYDARKAENQVALSSGAGLYEDSHNTHAELMTNWDFLGGKTRFVGGVAWNDQDVDTAGPTGAQTLMLAAKSEQQQSAFAQFDANVTSKVKFVLAGRYDDSTLHDPQVSPKAAVVFTPIPNQTFRYGYNRAFQRPNYSELFLAAPAGAPPRPIISSSARAARAGARPTPAAPASLNPASAPLAPFLTQLGFGPLPLLARGNGNLDVEKIKSHELGYAGIIGGKLYLTVDLYKSHLSNFVTDLLPGVNPEFAPYVVPSTVPASVAAGINSFLNAALGTRRGGLTTVNGAPALVFSYTNAGEVDTQGGEIALNYYLNNNWVLDANYSQFDFDVKEQQLGDRLLPNAPKQKWNAGIAWRGAKIDAKLSYRHVDEFDWAAGVFVGTVPSYDVFNLAGRYNFNDRFGFGVDISNLTDDEHYEAFGGDLMSRRALAFVTVGW